MKLLSRLAILTSMLFATLFATGTAASATTCPTGGGALLTIQRCATGTNTENVAFGFAGPATFGHFEIWKYGTTTAVNTADATWTAGTRQTDVLWNARTCIEFWKKTGSTWTKMNNEVDCTSS